MNGLCIIIERWARAYRDNSFHECIDTNIGTEALNRALKYSYLPWGQRSINLSKIVTLFVETFLPALRQKYLFANFEQSSVNRRYKMRSPNTYTTSLKLSFNTALIAKHPVLVFAAMTSMILMQQGESFKSTALKHISTQLISTFPHAAVPTGCSITTHANTSDWNALPQTYLASPRLSLDTDVLNTYFSDDSSIKVGEPTQDGDMGMGIHQVHAQEDDSTELDFHSAEIPKKKVSTS